MARGDGKRKTRSERFPPKQPKLGYFYIYTDTAETERNYLNGLKSSLPQEVQSQIVLKIVSNLKTKELLKEAHSGPQYAERWIVFDRDFVPDFDEIISSAEAEGIHVAWSNPCIEIWFHAYFANMPSAASPQQCTSQFSAAYQNATGKPYSKKDANIYAALSSYGDEGKAIERAKRKLTEHKDNRKRSPSQMEPATAMHILVQELKKAF